MNSIVYVGMDVHKEQYTLCCYSYETDKVEYKQTIPSDYKLVLKYMEQVRSRYDGEVTFVCRYEAGCLGYSLYHQLKEHVVDCKILAPSTMAVTNTHHIKTDKRDAANIARCLAFHTYSEVYVPDNDDKDDSSVRSAVIAKCPSPSSNSNVTFNRPSFLPVIMTFAPILEHSMAVAFPIPEEAPVINTALPTSEKGL